MLGSLTVTCLQGRVTGVRKCRGSSWSTLGYSHPCTCMHVHTYTYMDTPSSKSLELGPDLNLQSSRVIQKELGEEDEGD